MHIAICIASCNRPRLLQKLLNGIAELRFVKSETPLITVIVVDNDPSGTAKEVCSSAVLPWPIKYALEPKRGIAQARNRALEEIGDADFIAFIDDDEVPKETWLDELLSAQSKFQADAVAGPAIPSFTEDVPEWIRKSDFFDKPAHVSGESLAWCTTGNALVVRKVLGQITGFDNRFQLTGGEDVHFFMRIRLAGFKIVWSEEAVVSETISSERANVKWLILRAYRGGNSHALVESSIDDRIVLRFARLIKGCARILQGLIKAGASLFTGRTALIRALRVTSIGVGMLAGVAGVRNQAYKRVIGDPIDQEIV
jgi:succinoglycan biosynthesis protein ExoM